MNVNTLAGLIQAFFDVYQDLTVIRIVLPTGWFGKPYDNYYTLISIEMNSGEDMLCLDLSYGWRLSFKPLGAELSGVRRKLTVRVKSGMMFTTTVRQTFGLGRGGVSHGRREYSCAALTANGANCCGRSFGDQAGPAPSQLGLPGR